MQRVLDPPVTADGSGQAFGAHGPRGDEVAGLAAAAVLQFGPGLDLGDGGDFGEAVLAGEGTLPVEPAHVARDEDAPISKMAVALVEIDVAIERLGRASAKKRSTSPCGPGWLALTTSR